MRNPNEEEKKLLKIIYGENSTKEDIDKAWDRMKEISDEIRARHPNIDL